MNRECH